jgi:hypothetical protein
LGHSIGWGGSEGFQNLSEPQNLQNLQNLQNPQNLQNLSEPLRTSRTFQREDIA